MCSSVAIVADNIIVGRVALDTGPVLKAVSTEARVCSVSVMC